MTKTTEKDLIRIFKEMHEMEASLSMHRIYESLIFTSIGRELSMAKRGDGLPTVIFIKNDTLSYYLEVDSTFDDWKKPIAYRITRVGKCKDGVLRGASVTLDSERETIEFLANIKLLGFI